MSRNEFIDSLKGKLNCVDHKTVSEVLADLNEHFDEGLAHGESEQELVNRLGNVDEVANEIIEYARNSINEKISLDKEQLIAPLTGMISDFETDSNNFHQSRTIEPSAIQTIDVRVKGCSVEVFRADNQNNITVDFTGSLGKPPTAEMVFECLPGNGKLGIRAELIWKKKKAAWDIFSKIVFKPLLKISLPAKRFDEIFVDADMGSVDIKRTECQTLQVVNKMGRICLKESAINNAKLTNEMGAIMLSGDYGAVIATDNMGSVTIANCRAGNIYTSADMGSINVHDTVAPLTASANMGSIKIALQKITQKLELNTNMGSIKLTLSELPENLNYAIKTNMGSIKSDWSELAPKNNRMMGGNVCEQQYIEGVWLKAETNMGSIKIHKG